MVTHTNKYLTVWHKSGCPIKMGPPGVCHVTYPLFRLPLQSLRSMARCVLILAIVGKAMPLIGITSAITNLDYKIP